MIDVTAELGIGILAKHDDRDIGFLVVAAVRAVSDVVRGFRQAIEDGGAVREFFIVDAAALPGQRPAAGLFGDAVSAVASDHDVRGWRDWKDAVIL